MKNKFLKNKSSNKNIRNKTSLFYSKFFKNMSSIRQIFIWYILISIIGALLLWAPFSHNSGKLDVNFIDALFVSSSAFSDTGLSTVSISDTFNWFGQFITLILLNIGGVGWFTIKIFILTFILRKTLNYSNISNASSEVGTIGKNETLGLVFSAVFISFISTFLFGFIFSFIFYWGLPQSLVKNSYSAALWTGFYHASASINNSGLDVFKDNTSMKILGDGPYSIILQVFTMILFIIGGIGFGVAYDFFKYFSFKKTGKVFNFSLTTKISTITYAAISIIGLILVYTSEGIDILTSGDNSFLSNSSNIPKGMWDLTFNTFSTRNAGFSTMEMNRTSPATQLIQSIMMFIGSGPGSTAGGIRTTTLFILLASTWSWIRNKKTTNTFNRTIPMELIKRSYAILISSLMLVTFSIFFISIFEGIHKNEYQYGIIDIIFITSSAFGTTGLSTFDISQLKIYSKLLLIIIMFIGQIGMSNTILHFKSKNIKSQKMFAEENISLG